VSDLAASALAAADSAVDEFLDDAQGPLGPQSAGPWSSAWRRLRRRPAFYIPTVTILLFSVMAIAPGLFTDTDPMACLLTDSMLPMSRDHWFGTDLQGCDYFAKSIHGARVSMVVGISVGAFAFVVALLVGATAGYLGGKVDFLVSRVVDVWFAIPAILGAVVALSLLGERGLLQVTLVLVFFNVATMLRLMRASVLRTKELEFVESARALGASDLRIVVHHVLPNAISPVVVYATILVGTAVMGESAMTFLGVGLEQPAVSWGLMINAAQAHIVEHPRLLLVPAAFLSALVFSFVLLGDALRDALDPRRR
jgi:ABC-type dipeptide/oligopeptide/nickel transport system permease subunit